MTNSNIKIIGGDYEHFTFPGGEEHVRVNPMHTKMADISVSLKSSQDIMVLLLICDALRRCGKSINTLYIDYFPYARQDRVCNTGEALSVKVMADLINSIEAERVVVFDPHSDVVGALVNKVQIVEQFVLVNNLFLTRELNETLLVCPDAGAEKKIQKLKRPYLMARKVRDTKTGEIIRTEVEKEALGFSAKKFLIVDDICDGGRTFIELAKKLKEVYGDIPVELYVTHGIFSKGFDVFKGYVDRIHYIIDGTLVTKRIEETN
jgi:ribose-phosphate pyrophosphokinase